MLYQDCTHLVAGGSQRKSPLLFAGSALVLGVATLATWLPCAAVRVRLLGRSAPAFVAVRADATAAP